MMKTILSISLLVFLMLVNPAFGAIDDKIQDTIAINNREAGRRQLEAARAIGQPVEATNSVGMKLRLIPAGEFMMGSPEDEEGREIDEVHSTG
jgi:formylglycine-generating enzyme required for sulfatase activity